MAPAARQNRLQPNLVHGPAGFNTGDPTDTIRQMLNNLWSQYGDVAKKQYYRDAGQCATGA